MRLRLFEAAATEFLEATRHYNAESEELGASFVADVEATAALALAFPNVESLGPSDTRRLWLRLAVEECATPDKATFT